MVFSLFTYYVPDLFLSASHAFDYTFSVQRKLELFFSFKSKCSTVVRLKLIIILSQLHAIFWALSNEFGNLTYVKRMTIFNEKFKNKLKIAIFNAISRPSNSIAANLR